ncbi:hypothetical protein TNCV_955461 [Trichonephila clavipes]|nr:hypothetical protein TNCV_955461 [Trichonephila clavipes]
MLRSIPRKDRKKLRLELKFRAKSASFLATDLPECNKSNAERGKEFRGGKKEKEKLEASSVEKVTKKQKNSANSSIATAKSRSEYMREYQA